MKRLSILLLLLGFQALIPETFAAGKGDDFEARVADVYSLTFQSEPGGILVNEPALTTEIGDVCVVETQFNGVEIAPDADLSTKTLRVETVGNAVILRLFYKALITNAQVVRSVELTALRRADLNVEVTVAEPLSGSAQSASFSRLAAITGSNLDKLYGVISHGPDGIDGQIYLATKADETFEETIHGRRRGEVTTAYFKTNRLQCAPTLEGCFLTGGGGGTFACTGSCSNDPITGKTRFCSFDIFRGSCACF